MYPRLRNFRAGTGRDRLLQTRLWRRTLHPGLRRGRLWRGLDHFKAYIWSAVVAHNLVLFARRKLA